MNSPNCVYGGGKSNNEIPENSNDEDKTDIYFDQNDNDESESIEWVLKRNVNKVFKTCRFFPPDTKKFKYLKNSEGKYNEYIMKCPPVRPKGGQIFLFKPEQPLIKITISDHYRWYSSRIKISPENQIRRHRYYAYDAEKKSSNTKFIRYVYYLMNVETTERLYILAYLGNEKTYIDGPHGNQKYHLQRKFITSDKSVLQAITDSSESPSVQYKRLISEQTSKLKEKGDEFPPAYERTHVVRNTMQVYNKIKNLKSEKIISRDHIYNLYEIGINLEPFIKEYKLIPEIAIIFGSILFILESFDDIISFL